MACWLWSLWWQPIRASCCQERDLLAAGWQPGPALGAKLAALIEMWIIAGAPEGEAEQRRLLAQLLAR